MRPFLGRQMALILQPITGGQGPMMPLEGFSDVAQLQDWLREKFLNQDGQNQDENFKFEIRPIFEEVLQHHFIVRQKFEVILHRAIFISSPNNIHVGDFTYDYDYKHFIIDCDPTESSSPLGIDLFINNGVFSGVVVEVRKISSCTLYQDLKLVQNNEEIIKGRLFF